MRQNSPEWKIYVSCSGGTSSLWPTLTTRVSLTLWKHSPGNDVTLQSIKRPERFGLSKFNLEILRSSILFNKFGSVFMRQTKQTWNLFGGSSKGVNSENNIWNTVVAWYQKAKVQTIRNHVIQDGFGCGISLFNPCTVTVPWHTVLQDSALVRSRAWKKGGSSIDAVAFAWHKY